MADMVTSRVADYVDRMGINVKALSRGTAISYGILQRSLMTRERDLRADELLEICNFLGKDPLDFHTETG